MVPCAGFSHRSASLAGRDAPSLPSAFGDSLHTTLSLLQIGLVLSFTVANLWDHRARAWYLLVPRYHFGVAPSSRYNDAFYRDWNAGSGPAIAQVSLLLLRLLKSGFRWCFSPFWAVSWPSADARRKDVTGEYGPAFGPP